jgi:GTP pyrophosphokinase
MHLDESSKLGERLLGQALSSLSIKLLDIPDICWDRVLKETGSKSRQDLLTDIGLGRRLNMVIAKQLAKMSEGENSTSESNSGGVITLLGNEGMAIQYAKCCRPIPGDPIIGVIKSGQGLIVHTHDCPTLRKGRSGDEWLDVVWDKHITRLFDVNLKLIVANRRGVLAKVAAAIAESDSNIENVNFSNEGEYTAIYFTLQVNNRLHLATIMRNLRHIQEVIRIIRVKNTG